MEKKLKLNYKNTFFIGLAFFSILMLWQIYNTYCPLILNELLESKFQNADKLTYIIGIIMAMDNLAALILMPIFGNLSDKTKTKYGKRMPYILIGMLASAIVFPFIAVMYLINNFIGVILFMGLVLTIMQCYRSPAVALMPDITPKPLRSTANGIINLVGYIGAILGGVLAMIFKKSPGESLSMNYLWPFMISSAFMLLAMIILGIKINEPSIDLGIVIAIASSFRNVAVDETIAVTGEVGLTGEVRAVSFIEKRIAECKKLGFTKIVIPRNNYEVVKDTKGIEIWPVDNLRQAINIVLGGNKE